MKLQNMCLDSALDLWPPGYFELGFFASRIGCSEMEYATLFSLRSRKPRKRSLAIMASLQQNKHSENKRCTLEVS